MSLPVPYHLRGIAEETACTKDTLTLQLRCPCGCKLFRIFQNTLTAEEQAQCKPYADAVAAMTSGTGWARLADYMQTGNLRDFRLPEKPAFADLKRVSVQCTACGAETVIFDNRYHGYDGAVCGTEIPADYEPQTEQVHAACTVRIQLGCTVSESEFLEITDGAPFTEALFSECFTQIDISARDRDGVLHPVL